ncbi:hypothetical protein SAMN04488074_11531 [Lentzea albidocapillata subsp. violacea]|uniref:Uncharacterized protein n=1 Tax=Lentzea albidocapillata subsp. violacea TaxID=128104 RepID=A0A1G9PDV9_9PSEU|nr:hypothetical protein [Lentzea albidocapillata]SDL97052.1 hypothetical protein SAMN04488074_11531 [Lentzea albidocapillata subsp. violacea]
MQGQDVVVAGTNEMWQRLFSGQERWGWEFTAPALPAISPEAAHEPVAEQVYAPHDYLLQQKRSKKAWLALIGWLVVTFFAVALTGSVLKPTEAAMPALVQWATSIVLFAGVVLAFFTFFRTRRRFSVMKRRYDSQYNGAVQSYNDAYAAWRARIDEHNRREAERFLTAMLWHPLRLTSRPSRIDVFGGTEDGWASLLTTIGAAQLASGSSMLLLDFTDMFVGENLTHAAARQGYEVHAHEAPRDLTRLGLLTGLDPAELAEVLAESMHNLNRSAMAADLRGLHIDLLTAVAERLSEPITFTKLVAGLQVLRRVYDAGSDETLAAEELRKLNSYVDTVGNTDQVRNELQSLEGELRSLARAEQDADPANSTGFGAVWPVRGLAMIATKARTGRHRRFLDHVVFHRALQELHSRQVTGRETLVVAGADQIGLEALEAMARQARRSGVRLIFLIQHLRDDLRKLLGAGGTATLLMQLGNGEEAAAAAEFIGRGHKFVMSQLTEQIGKTLTEGTSNTDGGSDSVTHSRGSSTGGSSSSSWSPNGGNSSSGSSWSTTSGRAETRESNWSDTRSRSEARSETVGRTDARVYEFTVEPTTLQGLAPTAFVMVETGPTGRRVVLGDCNPGIVLLDRVALDARVS